jgi:hypothetical protein
VRVVAFDLETSLIRPGRLAPPISCMAYQELGDAEPHLHADLDQIRTLVKAWLEEDVVLVGHNIPFDLACIGAEWPDLVPLIFRAYDQDRVTDTRTRQKLLDISGGCYRGRFGSEGKWIKYDYSLLALAKRLAGIPIKKEGFRMFYGPLRGVPLSRWQEEAKALQAKGRAWLEGVWEPTIQGLCADFGDTEKFRTEVKGMVAADPSEVVTYPLDDARTTLAVYVAQEVHADPWLADQYRQSRRAWWLHLTSAWGLRTDRGGVASLQLGTERAVRELEEMLVGEGLIRKDGSRDTKKAKEKILSVCGWGWDEGLGRYEPTREDLLPLRLTDSGEPSLDADACKATDDEVLKAYAELTSLKTVLNKDVPALARGTIWPVHTTFDMAETGRTTSSNPNVHNWRRLPGIRECFVPRKGYVFAQADYSGLELATLAQACIDLLGRSILADVLNTGKDPHTDMASLILGISYDEAVALKKAKDHDFDNARQTSKVANFGYPGGLGAAKLCLFARKSYGVDLTEDEAKALKQTWFQKWPEMHDYFAYVTNLQEKDGSITLEQLRSKRIRGGATYTAACNSFFQGLGADATGHAGWLVSKACYVDRGSPLYGCRIVNYVHDEFIVEAPTERAPEAAEELSRLMVLGASEWIPDVKLQAEPCLMTLWSKEARTLRDASGRLIPWSPGTP